MIRAPHEVRLEAVPSRVFWETPIDKEIPHAPSRPSDPLCTRDGDVTIRNLADEIRAVEKRNLRSSSFAILERALDKVLLPEIGDLRPVDAGPDRVARLIRDLEDQGYGPATIRRYLSPLGLILRLAMRRGLISTSPLTLLSVEERATGGGVRDHYIWTAQEIADLIGAADEVGHRREAQYDYAPLIQLLALTGLRVSEALALQWANVDLAAGELHVRASLSREGELMPPKTRAGVRTVPLSQGLVDTLTAIKPAGVGGQ
jgi:integrase